MSNSVITNAATALFVPGHRSDRFAKASASDADFAIIDLEDAVPAPQKREARDAAVSAVSLDAKSRGYAVRINAIDDGGLDDALALAGRPGLLAVMVPKAQSRDEIEQVDRVLGGRTPLIPLVETAAALGVLDEVASAPRVARLAFGAYDFGADVDSSDPRVLDHARIAIVLASRRAGVSGALDSPDARFDDVESLRRSARDARALGMSGKLCIHPAQLRVCAQAFIPTPGEVSWAQGILDVPAEGATMLDGAMVDRPVRLRAAAILARSTRR